MHKNLATGSSFLCFDGKKFFSKRAKYSEIIVLLFRIVKLQFRSTHISGTLVALIACAVFLTNPSVLYMGIVPMMEAPFMMFFMLSVYYLQRLFRSHIRNNYEDSNISSEKSNT